MPWVDSVPTIVHAWYLGNATGDAIADVLFGKVNPSGKLPLTFPAQLEDVPSFGHFSLEDGKVLLLARLDIQIQCSLWCRFDTQRIFSWSVALTVPHLFTLLTVSKGYKHYQHRSITPGFAFGCVNFRPIFHFVFTANGFRHGLSYTTFQYSGLEVSEPSIRENDIDVAATFTVRNTGNVTGSEISQLYISWPSHSALSHPPLTLKAFSKISLDAGASCSVELRLDRYAVSSWSESSEKWVVENGSYTISVGTSSQELPLTAVMTIRSGFEWSGL
jgi:beta-glucosidase